MDEARLRGSHPGLDMVRLPGSGLVVTVGELNVLPDYLGRPEEIEAVPLRFIGPLIQSVRSWSIAELGRSAGPSARPPRLLPGAMRYPRLGPLAETAEISAVTMLGRRLGFAPRDWYASVLARNAGHFAPFSWYRWHSFHLTARALIARSVAADGPERESLRRRARVYAVSLPEWHLGGLRDLCFELFGQRSTRAVRIVMSSAFRQLGRPMEDSR